jgi:excisionase family DNA binding protein
MTLDECLSALIRDAAKLAIRDEMPAILREHLARADAMRELVRPAARDEPFSTRAAASYAGVSEPTIRAWAASGQLRTVRAGRVIKVRRSDLDAFLARSTPRDGDVIDLSVRAREILSSMRHSND